MNSKKRKTFLPILLAFPIISGLILAFKTFLQKYGFDIKFLLIANLLLLTLSLASFFLQRKGLQSANPHFFVRTVYISMIIKMFICMIAVTAYFFTSASNVNKPSLFTSMGIYLLYTAIEVAALNKSIRKKTNA